MGKQQHTISFSFFSFFFCFTCMEPSHRQTDTYRPCRQEPYVLMCVAAYGCTAAHYTQDTASQALELQNLVLRAGAQNARFLSWEAGQALGQPCQPTASFCSNSPSLPPQNERASPPRKRQKKPAPGPLSQQQLVMFLNVDDYYQDYNCFYPFVCKRVAGLV